MRNAKMVFMVHLGVVLLWVTAAQATNRSYTWTGAADNTTWANAGNWTGTGGYGNYPGDNTSSNTDNVTIGPATIDRNITTSTAITVNKMTVSQDNLTSAVNKITLGANMTLLFNQAASPPATALWTNTNTADKLILDVNGYAFKQTSVSSILDCPITIINSGSPLTGRIRNNGFQSNNYYQTYVIGDNVTVEQTAAAAVSAAGTWAPTSRILTTLAATTPQLWTFFNKGPGNLEIGLATNTAATVNWNFCNQIPVNRVQNDVTLNTYSGATGGAASRFTFKSDVSGNHDLWVGGNFTDYGSDTNTYLGQPYTNANGFTFRHAIAFCESPSTQKTLSTGRTGLVNDFRVGNYEGDFGNIRLAQNLSMASHTSFELRDNSTLNLNGYSITCGTFNLSAKSVPATLNVNANSGKIIADNITLNKFTLNVDNTSGGLNPGGGNLTLMTYTGSVSGTPVVTLGSVPGGYTWYPDLVIDNGTVSIAYALPGGTPVAATPAFSVDGGDVAFTKNVAITCATLGATIRYTTDGTTPTTLSPTTVNGGTVSVSSTTILKAKAWAAGYDPSFVKMATYNFVTLNRTASIPYGDNITVDGDLTDWVDVDWAPLDQNYDISKTAADVAEAYYAAKWGDNGTRVYMAVKVRDTSHTFTDNSTTSGTAQQDNLLICIHTTGNGGVDYSYYKDAAQAYQVGITNSDRTAVWTAMTATLAPLTIPVHANAGFQAAGRESGDWLYYEAAITPFQYFGGYMNRPNRISTLHGGDIIGLDAVITTLNGGVYDGAKSENMMRRKNLDWRAIGLHTLAARPGDVNGDNQVDQADLQIVLAAMDSVQNDPDFDSRADLDGDSEVTSTDLSIVLGNMD